MNSQQEKISLGIIGFGTAIQKFHIPALHNLRHQFEVLTISSTTKPQKEIISSLGQNIHWTNDFSEILHDPLIEAVVIAVPITLNYKICKAAISHQKHIMIEKPLAASHAEANELVALTNTYSKVAMVAENYLYSPTIRRVKEIIVSNKLGPIKFLQWNSIRCVDINSQSDWRKFNEHPGGYLLDGGIHFIAAIDFLLNEITAVSAIMDSMDPNLGDFDLCSFVINTRENVRSIVNLVRSSATGAFSENQCLIVGSKKALRFGFGQIQYLDKQGHSVPEQIVDDGGYQEEYRDFFHAIKGRGSVLSTFETAHRNLSTLLQVLLAQ